MPFYLIMHKYEKLKKGHIRYDYRLVWDFDRELHVENVINLFSNFKTLSNLLVWSQFLRKNERIGCSSSDA
jgi:hypothetical protein